MRLYYAQNGRGTLVRLMGLEGVAVCKKGDEFDPLMGIAVALLKLRRSAKQDTLKDADFVDPIDFKVIHITEALAGEIVLAALAYRRQAFVDEVLLMMEKLGGRHRTLMVDKFAANLSDKLKGLF